MESVPAANALPFIEASFAFLASEYGFELAQSTEIPSMAWFRRDQRVVIVAYDFMGDATIEVDLMDGAADDRYRLTDVLAFQPDLGPIRLEGIRERGLLVSELERLAGILASYGREFLAGDKAAFARRYREALLVRTTRAHAMREFYSGDPARARELFTSFRAYWDDRDREHFAQLEAGTGLRYLRRVGN